MKLYYQENGDVIGGVMDIEAIFFDEGSFAHSGQLVVDEISENHSVIREICRTRYQTDASGLHRYEVQNGELFERDGWTAVTVWQG